MDRQRFKDILLVSSWIACFILTFYISTFDRDKHIDNYTVLNCEDYNFKIDYNDLFEDLEKQCGGTYLVKRDNKWTVFKQVCKGGGFCKYSYVPISQCFPSYTLEPEQKNDIVIQEKQDG